MAVVETPLAALCSPLS